MTLQTVFFGVGIVALIAGVVVGAFAAFTYVKLEIRAVKDELSGAARARGIDHKAKKPAGSTSKMKAFSQVGWKGKVHSSGEATTDSFSEKTNRSGSLGVRPASHAVAEGARFTSDQALASDFATGEEPTSSRFSGFEGDAGDEPTSVGLVEEATTMLSQSGGKAATSGSALLQAQEGVRGMAGNAVQVDRDFRIVRKTIVLGSKDVLAD